jgi:predicted nucleic acid-binding protein
MSDKIFIDTNILVYLVKDNTGKAEIISTKIQEKNNSFISTQVVNEFCNVGLKKLDFNCADIVFSISKFSEVFTIPEVKLSTIIKALQIKEQYGYSFYDSAIIASALQNNCSILYTEDMQHQQIIENTLTIINPFK